MAVLGLVSGRGAPGVTTSALALALGWRLWPYDSPQRPERVLVVEADAAGSSAGPGYLAGQADHRRGMASVVSDRDRPFGRIVGEDAIRIEDEPDRWLLVGLATTRQVVAAAPCWPRLARDLRVVSDRARTDILIDFGRCGARAFADDLLDAVDLFVVVARSDLSSIVGARQAIASLPLAGDGDDLQEMEGRLVCLLVGEGSPYARAEIEASLAVPVAATLAWDPRSAAVLSVGEPPGRRFWRSPLIRSARSGAQALHACADVAADLHQDRRTTLTCSGRADSGQASGPHGSSRQVRELRAAGDQRD
jgi:hypothetical protein